MEGKRAGSRVNGEEREERERKGTDLRYKKKEERDGRKGRRKERSRVNEGNSGAPSVKIGCVSNSSSCGISLTIGNGW